MSKIWRQSFKGSAIDLVDVEPGAVDFREMCEMLAGINHHCGAAQQPVSAAMHVLIAADCADEEVLPWVLISGFHETRIGPIDARTKQALIEIAGNLGGQYAEGVRWTMAELTRRHDAVIHAAAGLPMPTKGQEEKIRQALLRATATERRDFLAESAKRWSADVEVAPPSTKVYRAGSFGKCAFDVGQALYRRLEGLLPGLTAAAQQKGRSDG